MRKLLVDVLGQNDLFEIVGDVSNGRELIDLLKKIEVDIVLLDMRMPIMDGLEALSIIRIRFSTVKVIILSFYNELFYIKDSILKGARSYLTKDCLPEELEKVILTVSKYGFYLDEKILSNLSFELNHDFNGNKIENNLTERELEILRELCDGKTEKEVAVKLKITRHTVHFHRTNIYSKVRVRNLGGLLKFAKESGIFG